MLDKMNRLKKMVTKLCLALEIDEDLLPDVEDAASLAMSDLATAVVTEFTALSGTMARHYALRDGYSEQVVDCSSVSVYVYERKLPLWQLLLLHRLKLLAYCGIYLLPFALLFYEN